MRVDPETQSIPELDRRAFTADEFARITPPACPVCGAAVEIQRIDITLNAEEEARHGRTYVAGMWECPPGCDPRTGERRHHSQTLTCGPAGNTLECSCGETVECATTAELAAAVRKHQPPSGPWITLEGQQS